MKLNNLHKMAIQGAALEGKKAAEIAAELDLPEKDVTTYMESTRENLKQIREGISAANKAKKEKKRTGLDNYARKPGVVINTPVASQHGDDSPKSAKPKRYENSVHIIDKERAKEKEEEIEEARRKSKAINEEFERQHSNRLGLK